MKKKVVGLVLTGMLSLALLGGCGSDKDKAGDTTPTQAATPTVEEKKEKEDVAEPTEIDDDRPVDPDEGQGRVEYEGSYIEPVGGRAVVSIETTDGISYNVHVEWSGSVSELAVWNMEAVYEESSGKLEYSA